MKMLIIMAFYSGRFDTSQGLFRCFQSPPMRLFGTNGIRGKIGEEFKPDFLVKVGLAIGTYLQKNARVILGTDTRISGYMVKNAVISGLLATGVNVIDIGIAPTPAIQLYTKKHGDFGIAITASHNPPEFNGVKCIASDGTELPREEEEKIERIFFSENFRIPLWREVGNVYYDGNANNEYINEIISKIESDSIRKKNFKVAVDCANGASCFTTPYLLRELGVKVVSINCNADGTFIGHPSEPREENLRDLIELVKDGDFDFGIAHDGDADRAIFIDENGRYLQGDRTLALVAKEIARKKKGKFVTPVSSSLAVEEVVKKYGSEVVYTKVGAPIVARKMKEIRAIFGGEENGGLIFPEMQYCRDGGFAVAKILEILAKREKKLSELIDEIPRFYQKKISVECPNEIKEKVLDNLGERLKEKRIISLDGIKIIGEGWWILIRPSGTEPIYRIYAEAKNEDKLEEIVEKYQKILKEIVKSNI